MIAVAISLFKSKTPGQGGKLCCNTTCTLLINECRQSAAAGTMPSKPMYNDYDDDTSQSGRPAIKSSRVASNTSLHENAAVSRPGAFRASTFEGPRQLSREESPIGLQRMTRVPSDNVTMKPQRDRLHALTAREIETHDRFSDPSDDSALYSSPERPYRQRSASPATSYGSGLSRQASYSNFDTVNGTKKAAPPPPPPPRSKKPPPPPPMKRSALSTTTVSYA